jgi:hypothetical protein
MRPALQAAPADIRFAREAIGLALRLEGNGLIDAV